MSEEKNTKTQEIGFAIPWQTDLSLLNSENFSLRLPSPDGRNRSYHVKSLETDSDISLFSSADDVSSLMQYVQTRFRTMTAPLRTAVGSNRTILGIILYSLLFILGKPFIRGWRLDIVRRVGLEKPITDFVPDLQLFSILRYLKKGFVLIIMRSIYFFPHLVFIYIASNKLFLQLINVAWWAWEKYVYNQGPSFIAFMAKTLPEVAFEIILQLVILAFYMVVVWPIYRITMIKYALGIIRGYHFLSPRVIRDSIRIYREVPGVVLGIYFWTFVVEFALEVVSTLISTFTLGLGRFFINPGVNLVFKHYPIGYAYGILAQKLLQGGQIQLKNAPPSYLV